MTGVDVPLGELITPARPPRAGARSYPLLSMTMHSGLVDQNSKFKKRIASEDTSQYKVIRHGQLVVGFPIDEGVLDVQSLYPQAIVSPAYEVWNLRTDVVEAPYLVRLLRSERALTYYRTKLRGSTARRRSLPKPVFLELPVRLPPIEEQRRIAAILDHVEDLRTRSARCLHTARATAAAIYRANFGGSTPHVPLGDLLKFKSGAFLPASAQAGGDVPVYGGNGINGLHDVAMFEAPVVVIGRVGAYCGAVHLTEPRSWVTDNALYVAENPRGLRPEFLATALSIANLNQYASQSGQPLISAGRIAHVEIPLPTADQQEQFESLVQRTRSIEDRLKRRGQALDQVMISLQARAFSGRL